MGDDFDLMVVIGVAEGRNYSTYGSIRMSCSSVRGFGSN